MGVVGTDSVMVQSQVYLRSYMKTCSFATSCWEKDWRLVLLDPTYLAIRQIANNCFPFAERLLIINNVNDRAQVRAVAEQKVQEGVLTRYLFASDIADEMLSFFKLQRTDFRMGSDAGLYTGVNPDWIYYNALGPLTSIYTATSDYLLYLTGDVRLDSPVRWIARSMRLMEKNPKIGVANLVWNHNTKEAKRESYKTTWNYYFANQGFSDQMFLINRRRFAAPIYGEIRPDSHHYPRGDVFEKRVFSFLKNRNLERITYRRGSYIHENVSG